MYHYVEDKDFLKRAQKECSEMMKELEEELRDKGMNTQFFLVGSGARNMVTQNNNLPIDFDYNLNIISCEDWKDAKGIKELVRNCFNKVLRNNRLSDCDDSTSSLTTKNMFYEDDPDIKFSMDICIVTKDTDDKWERLIHEKYRGDARRRRDFESDRYYWNIAPNSNKYVDKVKTIKQVDGYWPIVREKYLEIKNRHLSRQEKIPSFVCYIEAVSTVYNNMKQKGIL